MNKQPIPANIEAEEAILGGILSIQWRCLG